MNLQRAPCWVQGIAVVIAHFRALADYVSEAHAQTDIGMRRLMMNCLKKAGLKTLN